MRDGVRTVAVSGEIDAESAPRLEAEALRALQGARRVSLDLVEVQFCDSAGIGAVVRIAQAAERIAVELRVASNAHLDRLWSITGLTDVLPLT
jgi:anti-sigma B factor antagonist